jgi:phosphoenolpyruvate---glycerone phosphotransferase subunit DhaL
METVACSQGSAILEALIETIHTNAAFLSELDGAIGDGDHGINMDKGFLKTRAVVGDRQVHLSEGLDTLGNILLNDIGGAMGPIYGTFFMEMASACQGCVSIDRVGFGQMLKRATYAIEELGGAKVGDKTLLDTLIPANNAYQAAIQEDMDFKGALREMKAAAELGKESTRDMMARLGRSSRLGERSRGHLDAGATSCDLMLQAMADAIMKLLNDQRREQ